MPEEEIQVLSRRTNCPVVQMPERRFPGVVIQGDSLKILVELAEDIRKLHAEGKLEELRAAADYLKDLLEEYLIVYEKTLRAKGLPLPY